MLRLALYLSAALLFAPSATAQNCRHALILALDVSGSVDVLEYAEQTQGLARALRSPDVVDVILSDPSAPISIAVYEWSSTNHQTVIAPWTSITSSSVLMDLTDKIERITPSRQGLKTAVGSALMFSEALFAEQSHCWKRTVDVSADGINNAGPMPYQVTQTRGYDDIIVNALIVTSLNNEDEKNERIRQYYEDEVIHGPGSFSMVAEGYADYEEAMRRKLIRELSPAMLGSLETTRHYN